MKLPTYYTSSAYSANRTNSNPFQDSEKEKLTNLLEAIRSRFFSDGDMYKADIALKDIHNVVDKIFKYD